MFIVIISISIYIFRIYLILILSNCNAIQSTDCYVQYFNKLSIYLKTLTSGLKQGTDNIPYYLATVRTLRSHVN